MAEGVLSNIAGGIINNVVGLAAEEVKLFWGVKEELEKLAFTVSLIKAGLLDAEERQPTDGAVRLWLERLSNVLYEADDLLDAVSTNAQRRKIKTEHGKAKRVRKFVSKLNEFVFRLKMAQKIKPIRGKLDSVAYNMKFFKFVLRHGEPLTDTGRGSTFFETEGEFIGRENDKEKVIEKLLKTNIQERVSIISIVGIGGSGKTALARRVYDDSKIQSHFELRKWIWVESKSLKIKALENIEKEIKEKKFLLMLDDVWNENPEEWTELKNKLTSGIRGSKILVTTRYRKVAEIEEAYNLEGLKEDATFDLLRLVAFKDKKWPENSEFEEMGKEVLRKCKGVPLAIKTIGRMLYFKKTKDEWQSFVNNELSVINQNVGDILPSLKLSYNRLPLHLKRCFTYCSIYPKGYGYDKTKIIHEWIAHGFIESENQCLEDIGNDYFIDLFWRSFFQDPKENDDHVIIGCKVHDLLHDLATSLMARSLITTSKKKEWRINKKTCHLLVCEGLDFSIKELISKCEERMIRTFHCPNFGGKIDCEMIFSSFKSLRVLNLSLNDLVHVPNTIGKLKHLRYLDLSHNKKIKMLPRSCTKLVNLQFLNLSDCDALIGLPRGIKNLVNLRDLNLDGCSKMIFSSHNASLSEFKELNELRGRLIIWNLRHSSEAQKEYEAANVKEKIGLKSLTLHFSSNDEDHDNGVEDERIFEGLQPHTNLMKLEIVSYRSVRLPSWILSIAGLTELRLYKCPNCQYLPHVDQLGRLKVLCLREMDALDYILDDDGNEFSSSKSNLFPLLSKIQLVGCPKLKGWSKDSYIKVDRDNGHYSRKATIRSVEFEGRLPLFLKVVDVQACPLLPSTFAVSSSGPLSELKKITLSKLSEIESLQEEWLKSLASLETLEIQGCSALKSLSTGIQHLTALKYLDISWCKVLDLVGDEKGKCWSGLKSLLSLKVSCLPKLQSLPSGLQHVSTIQNVWISYCENLETILDSIVGWKSFNVLRIQECPCLIELPAGIERPAIQLEFIPG